MNQHRGDVTIKLGDTEYVLRPTFQALQETERLTGLGMVALARKFGRQDYGVTDMLSIIGPGIKGAGGKSPANLGDLIIETGVVTLGGVIAEYLANALTGGETKNAEAPEDRT